MSHKAAIIFNAQLAEDLATSDRLPPTYVGSRRIRASSKVVKQVLNDKPKVGKPPIEYRIKDETSGEYRRMNTQEKKEAKRKRKREQAVLLEKAKEEAKDKTKDEKKETTVDEKYLSMDVNPQALQQELADLRGERQGVPPVLLPPSLAQQGLRQRLFGSPEIIHKARSVVFDESLSSEWAKLLFEHMQPAEHNREQEDMRKMVYKLQPEVWSRFKPDSISKDGVVTGADLSTEGDVKYPDNEAFSMVSVRPRSRSTYDADCEAVSRLINQNSDIHISDGCKFGCDVLLYDGPRQERHAFAGIRILPSNNGELPMASSYDMTGYVRGMNTAGKLALLATVITRDDIDHIAVVDLALVKVIETVSGRKKKTLEERMANLSKGTS